MNTIGYRAEQIADSFQVGNEFQAGEELAGLQFSYLGDRRGERLIDIALDLIQLFFALLHRDKGNPR